AKLLTERIDAPNGEVRQARYAIRERGHAAHRQPERLHHSIAELRLCYLADVDAPDDYSYGIGKAPGHADGGGHRVINDVAETLRLQAPMGNQVRDAGNVGCEVHRDAVGDALDHAADAG